MRWPEAGFGSKTSNKYVELLSMVPIANPARINVIRWYALSTVPRVDDNHGQHRARKGEQCGRAEPKQRELREEDDADACPKCRAAGCADDVWIGQGIPEETLEHQARERPAPHLPSPRQARAADEWQRGLFAGFQSKPCDVAARHPCRAGEHARPRERSQPGGSPEGRAEGAR